MPYINLIIMTTYYRAVLCRHPSGARVFNPSDTRMRHTETALYQENKPIHIYLALFEYYKW